MCHYKICEDCTGFDRTKCGRRIGAAYALGVLSFFMLIVPLAYEAWFVQPIYYVTGGDYTRVGTIDCGLTTFTLKVDEDESAGRTGYTIHGKMSEILDYFPGAHGSAFDHLNTGGKQVLALVVPGLLLLVISYVAIGIYRFNSTPITSWWAFGGIIAHLLALIFFILAIIFYDAALYVGHSYLIYLTSGLLGIIAFLLQFGTTLMHTIKGDQPQSWVRSGFVVFFNFTAMCVACSGMATLSWIVITENVNDKNYALYIGLKKWEYWNTSDDNKIRSGDLSELDLSFTIYQGFTAAGNYALGFGIPGVVACTVAAAFAILQATGKKTLTLYTFILTGVGAGFLLCGTFLYGRTIFMGWSFSLFTVAPFVSLVSLVLMLMVLVGGGVGKPGEKSVNDGGSAAVTTSGSAAVVDPYRVANTGPSSLEPVVTNHSVVPPVPSGAAAAVAATAPTSAFGGSGGSAADPYATPAPAAALQNSAAPASAEGSVSIPVSEAPPAGVAVSEAPPIPSGGAGGNPFDA